MKKWLGLLLGGLFILGVGLWGVSRGVQIGKGYLVIGQGVKILDKASLDQAMMVGREAAGFYRPYLIGLAREGLVSQEYGLWAFGIASGERGENLTFRATSRIDPSLPV